MLLLIQEKSAVSHSNGSDMDVSHCAYHVPGNQCRYGDFLSNYFPLLLGTGSIHQKIITKCKNDNQL